MKLSNKIKSLIWYHTIDLGEGNRTPGIYDHRPYLRFYGIPDDLSGKKVLDVGTASGFFAFEMEKRGAAVTATELKKWQDHDFGPLYVPDKPLKVLQSYLHKPFDLAKRILHSKVKKRKINIYRLSPKTVGVFDITFCSSVLLHVRDPVKALWRIRTVTKEMAIIATGIHSDKEPKPLASFLGNQSGDTWWLPNKACMEAMVESAGFKKWHWHSEFRLDYRDGSEGVPHGVIHAFP
ncbi:MAG: methyltransferase domain-containing protein [Candidatus Aminicenantes bacterium]|nr:methyltransferase domain-containing protein [Candidatus Aminicenantes bacterium]